MCHQLSLICLFVLGLRPQAGADEQIKFTQLREVLGRTPGHVDQPSR